MSSMGMRAQVHKFSKFIHGTATLLPELVQAVPYWVDDESVRPSMLQSAPQPRQAMCARPVCHCSPAWLSCLYTFVFDVQCDV